MSIIVSRAGHPAQRLERTVIQQERDLQRYIYEHPDTLPLNHIKEDLKLLILLREFPTQSGPIDALGVDADGDLYVIETKLYKNPDKRLVIAQALDYGSALWSYAEHPEGFIQRLDELMITRAEIGLSARLAEFYGVDSSALTQILDAMKECIAEGRFHFVILMDQVDDRLKDLIRFLNASSNFSILGIGLDFYRHDDIDILIPTLFGGESVKRSTSVAGGRRRWDSSSFFADAGNRLDPATVAALRQLYDWSTARATGVSWGSGTKSGSFSAKFEEVDPRSVYSAYSNGDLALNFKWLTTSDASVKWAQRFGDLLRAEGVLPLADDYMNRYVYLKPDDWRDSVAGFIAALERLISRRH
jgi:hypothetical protein